MSGILSAGTLAHVAAGTAARGTPAGNRRRGAPGITRVTRGNGGQKRAGLASPVGGGSGAPERQVV